MKKPEIQAKLKKLNAIQAAALYWKQGLPSPHMQQVISSIGGAVLATAVVNWTATPVMHEIFPIPLWSAALLMSLAYSLVMHRVAKKARTHEAGIAQQLESYTPASAQDFANLQALSNSGTLSAEHVLQWCMQEDQAIRASAKGTAQIADVAA